MSEQFKPFALFPLCSEYSVGTMHPVVWTERINLLLGTIIQPSCLLSLQSCQGAQPGTQAAGSCCNEHSIFQRRVPGSSQDVDSDSSEHRLFCFHGNFWLLGLTLGHSALAAPMSEPQILCGKVRLSFTGLCISLVMGQEICKWTSLELLLGALPKPWALLVLGSPASAPNFRSCTLVL